MSKLYAANVAPLWLFMDNGACKIWSHRISSSGSQTEKPVKLINIWPTHSKEESETIYLLFSCRNT
jgi:hypothetical protein